MAPIIRVAVFAAVTLFATACGGTTACDEFFDFLVDCGVVTAGDTSDVQCDDDSLIACHSDCGVRAGCEVHSVPEVPEDQSYLNQVTAYEECIASCSP